MQPLGIPDLHLDFMCTSDNLTTLPEWMVSRAQRLKEAKLAVFGCEQRKSGYCGATAGDGGEK